MEEDLVYRLRKRAEIRRSISTRKSVQNNEPDRISDLLEEAAKEIENLRSKIFKQVSSATEVIKLEDPPYICLKQGVDTIVLLPEEIEEIFNSLF